MKLSSRLQAICDLLNKEDIISDIGTDHGLVPIYHLLNKKSETAYACDINPGPLNQAKQNIEYYKVNAKTILSDGIKNISGDTNTLVIAGMGNNTIYDILTNDVAKLKNINKIIIQSNTHPETIRFLLNKMDYKLVDEKVVYDKGKFYEVDCFVKGKETLSDIEIKYGKINLQNKEDCFIKKLQFDLQVKESIYSKSHDDSFLIDINEIKEILK